MKSYKARLKKARNSFSCILSFSEQKVIHSMIFPTFIMLLAAALNNLPIPLTLKSYSIVYEEWNWTCWLKPLLAVCSNALQWPKKSLIMPLAGFPLDLWRGPCMSQDISLSIKPLSAKELTKQPLCFLSLQNKNKKTKKQWPAAVQPMEMELLVLPISTYSQCTIFSCNLNIRK